MYNVNTHTHTHTHVCTYAIHLFYPEQVLDHSGGTGLDGKEGIKKQQSSKQVLCKVISSEVGFLKIIKHNGGYSKT